ncbi:MAG TPA: thiopurine S-methyltransferase [Rhodocyclaceae bacterium]|nr:thiopurine S-methyltransferase [Rhodocyclaceae bacterium]
MDPGYWLDRWARNEISFHQREANSHLTYFWHELGLPSDASVFVPLAGKSRDMLWLRSHGHPVLGVELSNLAVEAFFREAGLLATNTRQGVFERSEAQGLVVLNGDFFALRAEDITGVRAIYDRGALVAFSATERPRYVAQMADLLPAGSKTLLIVVEYDQSQVDGPPFAVSEAEVRQLYGATHDIRVLHEEDVLTSSLKFRAASMPWILEKVYLLTRLS